MPRSTPRLVALLAALGLVAAACAGSLSDQEVLEASGVLEGTVAPDGGSGGDGVSTTAPTAPTGRDPGGTETTGGPGGTGGSGADATGGQTGAVPCRTPDERGPIVIGSVGTYSGLAGAVLGQMPRAVQVWAAQVNARGGLCGRQVQVLVADDGGDPANHAATMQDMVENRDVVAFVGNGAGLSMDGGIGYLERAGVPVFGTECSRNEWFQHRVFFPQCATSDDLAVGMVRTGVRISGKTRLGFVTCNEAAPCQNVKRVLQARAREAGATIVYSEDISFTQIDFTAQCRNAQAAGVELMLVGADANSWLRFAAACERQGFFPRYVGEATGLPQDPHDVRGLEELIFTGLVFPAHTARGGAFDEFRAAVARYAGGEPTQGQALGWSSAKLFELAATRAARASGSITPKTLLEAGHTIEGETLGGLTTELDFTGTTPRNAPCTFTEQADGKGGWDAPLGTGPICP